MAESEGAHAVFVSLIFQPLYHMSSIRLGHVHALVRNGLYCGPRQVLTASEFADKVAHAMAISHVGVSHLDCLLRTIVDTVFFGGELAPAHSHVSTMHDLVLVLVLHVPAVSFNEIDTNCERASAATLSGGWLVPLRADGSLGPVARNLSCLHFLLSVAGLLANDGILPVGVVVVRKRNVKLTDSGWGHLVFHHLLFKGLGGDVVSARQNKTFSTAPFFVVLVRVGGLADQLDSNFPSGKENCLADLFVMVPSGRVDGGRQDDPFNRHTAMLLER